MKSKKIIMLILIIGITFLFTGATKKNNIKKSNQKKSIEVALFVARSEGDMFFQPTIDFMRVAAKQLNMNITVFFGDYNHIKMIENVKSAVSSRVKYDFLVYINFKKTAIKAVEIAETAKIPIFIMNSGFQKDDNMGKPREKYKYWIGEMVPDDQKAGYILANILIDDAKKKKRNGKVVMAALEGNIADEASIERKKGLINAVSERNDVILKQILPANWEKESAKEKYQSLLRRYGFLDAVWCASDGMALAVYEEETGLTHGKNKVIIGGVDWTKEGLESVEKGEISATIGGHFMEGGWVAVLLYDYYNKVDFADISVAYKSDMIPVTAKNCNEVASKVSRDKWNNIDFKSFSRYHNGKEKIYDFGLEKILSKIN